MPTPAPPGYSKYNRREQDASIKSQTRSDSSNSKQLVPTNVGDTPISISESEMELWRYVQGYLKHTPLLPIPKTGHIPQLLSLPRARLIHFNKASVRPYSEAKNQDIAALIIQITGHKAPHPCSRCQEDRGPFKGCYLISRQAPLSARRTILSCANCFYKGNQSKCDIQDHPHPDLEQHQDHNEASAQLLDFQQAKRTVPKRPGPEPPSVSRSETDSAASEVGVIGVNEGNEDNTNDPDLIVRQTRTRPRWGGGGGSITVETAVTANSQVNMLDLSRSLEVDFWEMAPGHINNGEGAVSDSTSHRAFCFTISLRL